MNQESKEDIKEKLDIPTRLAPDSWSILYHLLWNFIKKGKIVQEGRLGQNPQ